MSTIKRVCVFCGSSNGRRPSYTDMARSMGVALVQHGIGLVYGGGNVGLMGTLARTVLQEGGEVIGVIPKALVEKELAYADLGDLRIVGSMHERKALMADLSDAFVALPGGYGTLEEFCEIVTWAQLGLHQKPCGLVNIDGYYDALLSFFDHQAREAFVSEVNRRLILEAKDPVTLLALIIGARPVEQRPWLASEER